MCPVIAPPDPTCSARKQNSDPHHGSHPCRDGLFSVVVGSPNNVLMSGGIRDKVYGQNTLNYKDFQK
jgi:hypothetical protein